MIGTEFSNQFDLLFNNITSNQAPGLNEYEKSVLLTKAQNELVLNYFNPKSRGNVVQEGFDSTPKRQMDFSRLIKSATLKPSKRVPNTDPRAIVYMFNDDYYEDSGLKNIDGTPVKVKRAINDLNDVFLILNEQIQAYILNARRYYVMNDSGWTLVSDLSKEKTVMWNYLGEYPSLESVDKDPQINDYVLIDDIIDSSTLQVIPINIQEYSRLMSKPFKEPFKRQAWRLLNNRSGSFETEVVMPSAIKKKYPVLNYHIMYIKRPLPIILGNLQELSEDLSIDGYKCGGIAPEDSDNKEIYTGVDGSELDPIMHEAILQRAVELAKIAWTGNVNEVQLEVEAGKRSE